MIDPREITTVPLTFEVNKHMSIFSIGEIMILWIWWLEVNLKPLIVICFHYLIVKRLNKE